MQLKQDTIIQTPGLTFCNNHNSEFIILPNAQQYYQLHQLLFQIIINYHSENKVQVEFSMFPQTILKSEISQKEFDFNQFQCHYTNSNQMKIIPDFASNLQVTNYLAKKQGNILRKVTLIHLDDKLIILQDRFDMQVSSPPQPEQIKNLIDFQSAPSVNLLKLQEDESFQPQKLKQFRKSNKTLMPKKSKIRYTIDKFQGDIKRDTKNIPRNVLRVFTKHLQLRGDQIFNKVIQKTQALGYNNTLISEIINDVDLINPFKAFLEGPAQEWLECSRIKDKESHIQAIDIYLRMIEENGVFKQNRGEQQVFQLQKNDKEMSL